MVTTPMSRVAVVAPTASLRPALVRAAGAGVVQFDQLIPPADLPASAAGRALQRLGAHDGAAARLSPGPADVEAWEAGGRADLLAGEDQLTQCMAQAVARGEVSALVGWAPSRELPGLVAALAPVHGVAVELPRPRGVDPPTAPPAGVVRQTFAPLVQTYGTVPYADIDPSVLAGLSYTVMFGAMFGDVGHGALLLLGALLVRFAPPRRLRPLRPHWLFVAAAGVFSMVFGFAYGECFGPTGLVPAGLIAPMEQPVAMLVGGIALGAFLLGGAFAVGTINRVREGGWGRALYDPSGAAGALVFAGAGLGVAALFWHSGWVGLAAVAVAVTGLVLAYVGLFVAAGGGGSGALQAGVEVFDLVIRLGANVVSFARLAAFGLTHAVLGWMVWTGTVALWDAGGAGVVGAVAVFVLGNVVTFGIEALVASIQALRLEYYELFSRVFASQGRPFQPWHVPTDLGQTALGETALGQTQEAPC